MNELFANLDSLLSEVLALEAALNAEFEAIKSQDLDQLDVVQKLKEESLHRLADGRFEQTITLLQSHSRDDFPSGLFEKWQQLKVSTHASQLSLKRNELVIQRKLAVLRDALQAIYQTDMPHGLQLYNRTGKLARDSEKQ